MKEALILLIMFWNLENFFDPFNNQVNKDIDFTPSGYKNWTYSRFLKKRDNIAKTIILCSDYYKTTPAIIGLCEIENRLVLEQLAYKSILETLDYTIIHKESNDARGIDLALLYKKEVLTLLRSHFFKIKSTDTSFKTRDILYAKFLYPQSKDTIHCLVNHWPSKLGNKKTSNLRRLATLKTLNKIIDSINCTNKNALIIAMGDFNENSNSKIINSINNLSNLKPTTIGHEGKSVKGSYKYKGQWENIDQFLLSDSFKNNKISNLQINSKSMQIFSHPFLLLPDKKYLGYKPFRTTLGPQYIGGTSDHLPIILIINPILQ